MQRPSDAKREAICRAAACLFAARPYHEVRQEDIAERAGVGKGTLYIYFKSKDDLYLALAREGFAALVERVRERLDGPVGGCRERLAVIFGELTGFAAAFPELHTVMRTQALGAVDPEVEAARAALARLIEGVLCEGVRAGEIRDEHPELTARIILAFGRGLAMFQLDEATAGALGEQLLRVVWQGVGRGPGVDA
jgi:AcrR family transcriptional regulator